MKTKIILILLIICSLKINAQQNVKKCLTTQLVKQELLENSDYVEGREKSIVENKAWLANDYTKRNVINIPVVIHVVYKSSHANIGTGSNISDAHIEDALRILNEDYSQTNPEFPNPPRNTFLNYVGNPNLKFCLATTDPNGNPTNGVTRTSTTKASFDADTESNDMKKNITLGKDGWDPSRYLNIWICNLSNSGGGMTLGYAYLPGLSGNQKWKDGLVVDYQYFGTLSPPSGGASPSSDGRTATHEIGHYLGLYHTFAEDSGIPWNNPCVSSSGNLICCDSDDYNVWDTPATNGIYWGSVNSSTNNNTCNDISYPNIFNTDVLDMDENYMSYATTTWMFTPEQVHVMDATLNGYRSSLKNSTVTINCNGTITGVINSYQLANISIYPNPSLGLFNIESQDKIQTISISNILGDIILLNNNFSGNTIDLRFLENGIYFININTKKGIHIEKIILSK